MTGRAILLTLRAIFVNDLLVEAVSLTVANLPASVRRRVDAVQRARRVRP